MSPRADRLEQAAEPGIGRLLLKLTPGDPYSDPWSDLAAYGRVHTERFLLGLYYVSFVAKAGGSAERDPAEVLG